MDQVELLKMYAVRLAQRLGDNQKCLEFTASRDTGYGIETMTAEVSRYGKFIKVIYYYEGCHANKKLPKRKALHPNNGTREKTSYTTSFLYSTGDWSFNFC